MTPKCAARLKVEVTEWALPMKITFAQRPCQAAQVAKGMRFKAGRTKFDEDFTICELEGVS